MPVKNGTAEERTQRSVRMDKTHRKHLSEARLKRKRKYGYVNSPETRKKISLARMGMPSPKGMLGKSHSEETKRKISSSMAGNKNGWRGGVTPLNERIRKSKRYKKWRKSVFERDNYTCVECKAKGVRLQADHIKPFADYPKLRFVVRNGRTLCVDCHKKTKTFGRRKVIKK